MGPYGLGYAQSLVAMCEVVVLLTIMNIRIKGLIDSKLLHAFGRMLLATILTSIICYIMVQLFQLQNVDNSFIATFPKFTLIGIVSVAAYLTLSKLLKLKEADPILHRVYQLFFARAR